MKITRMLICSLAVGIVLIGTGCNGQGSSGGGKSDQGSSNGREPNAEDEWKALVDLRKGFYDLLSVEESQHWLEENADMTDYQKALQGITIDIDPNGNRRVFKLRGGRPPQLDLFAGWMTAEESETWLRNNHYQVQKKADSNGYIITRNITREGFNYKGSWTVSSGSIIVPGIQIPGGIVNIDKMGKLRVKASGTQY